MTKATTSKIKLKNDLFKWQTLLAALTGGVFCRNSDSRCLLQLYQTTIWCNKQTHFFTLQLCFPLPGQLRCITIACPCFFFSEKWSEVLSPQRLHVFYIRTIFIRKWASKPQNLKKMLRKSPASIAWAAIFKNADFS